MARYLYAATPADYVVNASTGLPVPGAVVTVWTARTGGSQVTDLQTLAGGAITQVTADAQGFIAFYGPDAQNDVLWIYAGSGSRLAVRPVMNPTEEGSVLPLSGGTLTGALTLSGAPTVNLHAATKKYVDDNVAGFLSTSGGTMTGSLRVSQASAKVTGDASTYVFARRQGDGTGYGFHLGATSTLPISAALYDSGGSVLPAALNYSTSSSRWNVTGNMHITGTLQTTGVLTPASIAATTMAGPLAMGANKITGLGTPTAEGDALPYQPVVSYTPTVANWTLGNGTCLGKYVKVGSMTFGWVKLILGSTTSISYSNPLRIQAPTAFGSLAMTGATANCITSGTYYNLGVVLSAADYINVYALAGSTFGYGWPGLTNGDTVQVAFWYETG